MTDYTVSSFIQKKLSQNAESVRKTKYTLTASKEIKKESVGRKDMSNELKEAFVAALQSQKAVLCHSQTGFCPSFYCEKDRWKDSCQLFQEWAAQQIHPKDRPCNA